MAWNVNFCCKSGIGLNIFVRDCSTEVLFIGLSYALLVVNLKNLEFNIFCLDYFDHDVWRHQGSA